MEHLNNLFKENYAKLRDLYLSMTLGNRIVSALLLATLLISLGYLIVGSIKPVDPRAKTVRLYNGHPFTPNEMRAAEDAISRAGLQGHQWIGDQLQVPTSRQAAYIATLAENRVLGASGMARIAAAEALTPWQSARMMDTQMLAAKEQDAVDAIRMITGIAHAKVVTNRRPSWERNVWARTQIMSVGVFVEAIENRPLNADAIGAIGQIIAPMFGITDMKEIRIVDTKHNRAYDGSGEQQGSSQSEYLRHQVRWQETFNERIYQLLPAIDGLKVETSVALTTYRSQRVFTVEHDRPTPLVIHELDYHFKKEGWDRFFRPGQVAQWSRPLIDPTGDVSPRDLIDEKKREMETSHALPGREKTQEDLPYIPERVRVSIQIPRDHIVSIWRERNRLLGGDPDTRPAPEELRAEEEAFAFQQKESVAQLLVEYRASAKEDPMDLVTVVYSDRILPEETILTAWEMFVLFLRDHWQSLVLMSLVGGGLVVLWSISKPPKPDTITIYEGLETPLEAIDARIAEKRRLAEEAAAAAAAAEEEAMQQEFENTLGELGSLRSLKDEIAELIRDNPEAAAAIIRQWIGNAVLMEAKS